MSQRTGRDRVEVEELGVFNAPSKKANRIEISVDADLLHKLK